MCADYLYQDDEHVDVEEAVQVAALAFRLPLIRLTSSDLANRNVRPWRYGFSGLVLTAESGALRCNRFLASPL